VTPAAEDRFQFERHGYFVADRVDSQPGAPVFNRTVTLKDSWTKARSRSLTSRRANLPDQIPAGRHWHFCA